MGGVPVSRLVESASASLVPRRAGFVPGPRAVAWLAFGLAAAAGLSFTGRFTLWFGIIPPRLEWFLIGAGVTCLLAVPFRFAALRVAHTPGGWPSRTTLGLGAIGGVAWHLTSFGDGGSNLWVHSKAVAAVLGVLLVLADVALPLAAFVAFARLTGLRWDVAVRASAPAWGVRRSILPVLACVAFANVVAYAYSARERFVPYWDYGLYWTMTGDLASAARESPAKAWSDVATSVRENDYNLLPAVLPAAAAATFGDGWVPFRYAVVTSYFAAVAFAAAWAVRRTSGRPPEGWSAYWPAALVATCPILWAPTLRGYVDLGGVAFALAAFGLYLKGPSREESARSAVALGVTFAAIFLFRRWLSIWVVSFVAVAATEAAVRTARAMWDRRPLRDWLAEWRGLAVAGYVAAALLVVLAYPLLVRVVRTDYAASYAGYKLNGTLADRTVTFFDNVGWAYPIAFAASAIVAAMNPRTRRAAAYAVAVAAVAHVQFHRIQDLGLHHRMLYAPSFLLVAGIAGVRAIDAVRGRGRLAVWAGLVGLSGFGLALTLVPEFESVRLSLRPLAPSGPYYPPDGDDPETLRSLAERANREACDRRTSFLVVSSSAAFNQTHTLNVHRALVRSRPVPWAQEWFPEVDKTGGFPDALFRCGVVVVAEPAQVHLDPREQMLVAVTAEALLSGTSVGAAFRRLPDPVELGSGVRAWVFVRSRPLNDEEVDTYRDRIRAAHPAWPMVYEPRTPVPPWPDGMTSP